MAKINASEVPGMIQDRLDSHYHLYEIKDIIAGLSQLINDTINEGYEIKIQGVGTFRPKASVERQFKSGITGRVFTKKTNKGITFKPDLGLIEQINKEVLDT